MGACVLVSATGHIDVLPSHTQADELFDQGPLLSSKLENGWYVSWSSSSYHMNEVNQFASSLVKQLVKGDACLKHPSCHPLDLEAMLMSRQLQLMSPAVPRGARKQCSSQAIASRLSSSSSDRIRAIQCMRARIMSFSGKCYCHAPLVVEGPVLVSYAPDSVSSKNTSGSSSSSSSGDAPQTVSSKSVSGSSSSGSGGSLDPLVPRPQGMAPRRPPQAPDAAAGLTPWDALPAEVVSKIARGVGGNVGDIMPLYSTSRSWQMAILGDDQLLKGLTFTISAQRPWCGTSQAALQIRAQLMKIKSFPKLLDRARLIGNVSAMTSLAHLLDAGGRHEEAMIFWRRCAKAATMEGQLRLGLALYRGTCGVVQDAEDAHLYLNRAVKQVLAGKEAKQQLPPQEAALAAEVLRSGGLILGYLHFDGEGTKNDREEATRFFKLAAGQGCKEAEQVLGWIFNTGQYG